MFSCGMGSSHTKNLFGRFTLQSKNGPSSATMDIKLKGFFEKTSPMDAQFSGIRF